MVHPARHQSLNRIGFNNKVKVQAVDAVNLTVRNGCRSKRPVEIDRDFDQLNSGERDLERLIFITEFSDGHRAALREEVFVNLAGIISAIDPQDRKSTRLNSSHVRISYAVFC